MENRLPTSTEWETQLGAYDYELPEALIASHPQSPRDESRLLVVDRRTGHHQHRRFNSLPEFLRPGDLLVLNNTKVLPARIYGTTASGRTFELLLLRKAEPPEEAWVCLVRPGKKIEGAGSQLHFPGGVNAVVRRHEEGRFLAQFEGWSEPSFLDWLQNHGELPLPPYLKRPAQSGDAETYQTVYAKHRGSVAAPTAGLHFSHRLLEALGARGIATAEVTLHIGYGTFSPLKPENLQTGRLHAEWFQVPESTFALMQQTRAQGGRIVAVGTTALRAIESIASRGLSGETTLFIQPGFSFRWTDALVTNFHLPQSSLFVLVAAFLGLETTHECYREAVANAYRFYSYGDAMLIL